MNIRSAASHPNRHASKPEAAEVWVLSASAWAVKHLLTKHSNLSGSSISTHTLAGLLPMLSLGQVTSPRCVSVSLSREILTGLS